MRFWSFYLVLVSQNKVWLRRVIFLAFAWLLIGVLTYLFFPEILPKFQKILDEVFRGILGGKELTLTFRSVLLIFRQNFTVSLLVLFLGAVFGILPFLSVAVNFFVVGFLWAVFVVSGKWHGFLVFLSFLFPHGFLEIPAFLITAAFGLRLGFSCLPAGDLPKGERTRNLKTALLQNLQIVSLLGILLFLAALLEVFVAGNLVGLFKK